MKLSEVIEIKKQEYINNPQILDEQEDIREWLLSLPTIGLIKEDYKTALQIALPIDYNSNSTWNYLKDMIYQYYMLDIGEEQNPIIKEVFWCWLNLDTMDLSTTKKYDPFIDYDNHIKVKDYRILGKEITWKDLVIKDE